MNTTYAILTVLAMAVVTFLIRATPFLASGWLTRLRWVKALGEFLPLSIMVLLVLHSTFGEMQGYGGSGLYEAIAIAVTVIMQWYVKNPLVSIFSGAGIYVVLRAGILWTLL